MEPLSIKVCVLIASNFFNQHNVPLSFYPCPWVPPQTCIYSTTALAANPFVFAKCYDKFGNVVYDGKVSRIQII